MRKLPIKQIWGEDRSSWDVCLLNKRERADQCKPHQAVGIFEFRRHQDKYTSDSRCLQCLVEEGNDERCHNQEEYMYQLKKWLLKNPEIGLES